MICVASLDKALRNVFRDQIRLQRPVSNSTLSPNPPRTSLVATNAECTASDTTEYSFPTSSSPSESLAWHA